MYFSLHINIWIDNLYMKGWLENVSNLLLLEIISDFIFIVQGERRNRSAIETNHIYGHFRTKLRLVLMAKVLVY